MKYKAKFLDDAIVDLNCIEKYLLQFYPNTARKFLEKLKKIFLLMEETPYIYPAYELDPFFRKMVVDDYILFYSVDEKCNLTIIHRIFHSKRDVNTEMRKYHTGEMEVNETLVAYHNKNKKNMKDTARDMLDNNIIPFWNGLMDEEYGGFYGFMDIDLNLDTKADKGCILNSRILWFFSEAARVLGRDDLLMQARHAYLFLINHCLDSKHGGIFWSVTFDGQPADTTKHTYNQAFAIYALAAYYEASGDKAALDTAFKLFNLLEEKCTEFNGYGEAYDCTFTPIVNDKLSENNIIADRTMNTLLHVFEAYSGLYRTTKSPEVKEKMLLILNTFVDKIYNPVLKRQDVFFDADWNCIIDLISYGHDIESSWLIEWGCKMLDDPALMKQIKCICSDLTENVYNRAFREKSLRNECERGVEDESRIWWVQAEAVVGFLNMAEKHPEQTQYLSAAEDILAFIEDKIVDKRPGSEWLSEVMADGSHTANKKPIVEEWKCPYHNGRMCLEILQF